MEIIEYIIEDALILIPVLFVLGLMLKRTPGLKDWIIPWALLVVGVGLAIIILGEVVAGIIQGVLVVGATVFVHQLAKQTIDRK